MSTPDRPPVTPIGRPHAPTPLPAPLAPTRRDPADDALDRAWQELWALRRESAQLGKVLDRQDRAIARLEADLDRAREDAHLAHGGRDLFALVAIALCLALIWLALSR